MANINKIRLSGQTYNIEDVNASKTVELTQAQYDALTVKDPNTFYIITDAQAADLSQYYTSAQTESAITQAVSGKQDTLISGTNIKTINNESILGSGNINIQGGGKEIEAGRGISITTGETADTVSFNLPIYSGTNNDGSAAGGESIRFTTQTSFGNSKGLRSIRGRYNSNALGEDSICFGINSFVRGFASFGVGRDFDSYGDYATIFGYGTQTKNLFETAIGKHNTSNSGSTDASKTLFSVGNGTSTSARHNAFEIRMNGDIYITKDGSDIKLQDQLGGGGSSYTAGDGIDITNDVISVTGKADTSAVTESINAAVSGKADTSDVFITSSNRNSIVSNIHEEVYQLSTDDIYSITATKASSGDIIYCQIMIDNTLYDMQGSSSSITYSDEALSGLVTADFSTLMSITLNDRENHHINEVFIEAFNTNDNSYIKEITIVHNPPIGANKIDYVSSIYTEFVHDQYAMKTDLNRKQDTLVSGTNIKTINNESILGSGNITIQGGGSVDQTVISGSTNAVAGGAVYTQLDGLKLKKITQSAYDALSPNYDANTLYVING